MVNQHRLGPYQRSKTSHTNEDTRGDPDFEGDSSRDEEGHREVSHLLG